MISPAWGWSPADRRDGATRHMDARNENRDWALGDFSAHRQDDLIWFEHNGRPRHRILELELTEKLIGAAHNQLSVAESRGFFKIDERIETESHSTACDRCETLEDGLLLSGTMSDATRWTLVFQVVDSYQIRFELETTSTTMNRLTLRAKLADGCRVFGFGEQFTRLNLAGSRVPVLSQEPGIGRGVQPLTWVMNKGFGAGGSWSHSNAPMPWFLTSDLRSMCLENTEYSVFDFTTPGQVDVQVFAARMTGRFFAGSTPLDVVSSYTRFSGRMRALPKWVGEGAIIGMQGGTDAVTEMKRRLDEVDAPIAAFWVQDWIGARKTSVGWQLWWNWELDHQRYPGWVEMRERLKESGIRLMSYINPFLVDPAEKGQCRRNLYKEAADQGFLIKNADGEPYQILNTSFSAALVDLANPDACDWLKSVIREQLIETGVSGWMADFGEALPFDAKLHDDVDAAVFHNEYPEVWARINREAVQEAGLDDEIVFFMRSGFTRSPRHCTLFWMGDQLTSWRVEDGIKSTLVAMLSSGLSGMSLNHSDIGGYTATTIPSLPFAIPGIGYTRGKELLLRWIELNAFTPVYRTHEGNQPSRHHQIDGDQETLAHFARFARLFRALSSYRSRYLMDAAEQGYPVIRSMWTMYPDDPMCLDLAFQFMLGDELLVAPVLDPKTDTVRVYLPAGCWVDPWRETVYEQDLGQWHTAPAPIGQPAVFCAADSLALRCMKAFMTDEAKVP